MQVREAARAAGLHESDDTVREALERVGRGHCAYVMPTCDVALCV